MTAKWQPSGGVLFLRGYKIIGFLCPKGEVIFKEEEGGGRGISLNLGSTTMGGREL